MQVPTATRVMVVPPAVHTVGVVVENDTTRPDDAVAATVIGGPIGVSGSAPNVIVWSALVTANVCVTVGAAL